MSKISEALRKIDVQGVSNTNELQRTAKQASAGTDSLRQSARHADLKDAVPLHISARVPIVPFSEESNFAAAEQYRIIRTKILQSANSPRLIAFSSPSRGDGKTVTCINVAAALSLIDNTSVLILDVDLRCPRVAEAFGIPNTPGIAEVLSGNVDLRSALVRAREFPNLYILPAGMAHRNPAELLHSEQWISIVEHLRSQFSVVVMDTTPVALVADYELVQHISDGVILIVAPGRSDRNAYEAALKSIPKEKLLGIVLNRVPRWWSWKIPAAAYYYKSQNGKQAGHHARLD